MNRSIETIRGHARKRFLQTYNGQKNFMTPEILEYGSIGPFFYELSRGDAFLSGGKIYGVTILEDCPDKMIHTVKRPDLSACYHTKKEAIAAIESLLKTEAHNETA